MKTARPITVVWARVLASSAWPDRRPLDAFAQRGPGDRERVDVIGLAAVAVRAALAGHRPGRDPDDALAVSEQETLERARDMLAVL
jgi:hypothetical protein